jgi:hypothetical protein
MMEEIGLMIGPIIQKMVSREDQWISTLMETY